MRIGYDAFPMGHQHGGIGVYTRQLLQSMLASEHVQEEFVAYLPKNMHEDPFPPPGGKFGGLTWVRTDRFSLRWRGKADKLDLYHGTNFKFHTQGRYGVVLNIHDLWLDRHPEYSKKVFGQTLSSLRARRRAARASHIIAISHSTAKDIEECYGIAQEKITVVYPGVSGEFYPHHHEEQFSRVRTRIGLPTQPYILFIGGADPRKNHQALFEAFATHADLKQRYYLVAVGDPLHYMGDLQQTGKQFDILDRTVFPGSVSRDELRMLYSHAELFVFPSRCEGFGFPVLEAMACGVPVVTSSTTALPEVAGDAAVLVDPDNHFDLGRAMVRVLDDQGLQEILRKKGFDRVKQFSWEQTARKTLDVYKTLCR